MAVSFILENFARRCHAMSFILEKPWGERARPTGGGGQAGADEPGFDLEELFPETSLATVEGVQGFVGDARPRQGYAGLRSSRKSVV